MKLSYSIRWGSLLLACFAMSARAQAPAAGLDLQVSQTVTDSCSVAEPVALGGTIHFDSSSSTDVTTGVNQFHIRATSTLSGTGQTSQAVYGGSAGFGTDSSSTDTALQTRIQLHFKVASGNNVIAIVETLQVSLDASGNFSASLLGLVPDCGEQ